MRIPTIVTALVLSVLAPDAVWAHVQLSASTPATGAQAKALKSVTLTFSLPVNQNTASAAIVMTGMPGMKDHGEMVIRNFTPSWSTDGKTLTLTLAKPLPKGTYQIRWQAAANDGHVMAGTVDFNVS